MILRTATAADQAGILELIDTVLGEYGDRICLDQGGAEADLIDLEENYFRGGGMFWVLHDPDSLRGRRIAGTHAAVPDDVHPEICRLKRLYLAPELRGLGWGQQLMAIAVQWTWDQGYHRIEFWSDSRFQRAHRFFQNFGFCQTGNERTMTDSHQPYAELEFYLDRNPKKAGNAVSD